MGPIRLGRVIKAYIAMVPGSGLLAQWLAVEELAGDERKAQIFGPSNEDFAPPLNTKTIDVPLGPGRGFLASVAYHNQNITPVATAGERRIYSTNAEGDTVMSEVFLHDDGTLEIKNAAAIITIFPTGALSIWRTAGDNINMNNAGTTIIKASVKIVEDAPVIELNGDTDNLTMWTDLNAQLQVFITAYNAHKHTGAGNPPLVPGTLDITGARADTLKTDG